MSHPASQLDHTVHQRVRLGILAILVEVQRADFKYLRGALDLTDGNLARHLQVLEEAGHVRVAKTFEGRRPRTWVSASAQGRSALRSEVRSLRALIDRLRTG